MKPTLARHDRLRAAFFPSSVDLKRRVVRGAGYTFFGVAIRIVLTMGSTAVLARLLMPEDYGLVALASIVTEFAAILNTISLSAILIQRKRLARIQCDTVFWFTVGMGVVAVFVLVAFAPLFARLLDDIRIVPLLRAMSILFLVEQLMVIQHVTMMRLMMFDLDLKVQVSALLARITVSIVGASLGWGPWALVAGSLAGTFLSVAYMWHAIPYRPRRRFQWSFLAANMKTSASMLGNGVMAYALGNIDYVIVGRRFGATELGFYQAAASLAAELRNRLAAPLQKVLFPAYSLVHGERERFERGVTTSLLLLASAVAPLGFGLSAVASEVISIIYGEKWLPAIPLLQALGIAGAMRAIFGMTNSIFYSINRTDVLFRLTLLGAPGRVLMIIIGSYWGALGVAYALTISQFSGFFGGAVAFRLGRIPIRYYWASLWPPVLSSAAMFVVVTIARPVFADYSLAVRAFGLVVIGILAYFAVLFAVSPHTLREVASIARAILVRRRASEE